MVRLTARLVTIEAARSLARNKVRSSLAILGIMVGVATVICVVSIGRAGSAQALSALDALGENLVWIEAGSRNAAGVRTGTHGMTTLVPADADAIRAEAPLIARVSENLDGRVQIIAGDANWQTGFRGISPDYLHVRRWEVARGEFINDDDVTRATTALVIGDTVRRKLFGDEDPIGQSVRIRSSQFTVVGVLAPKGQSMTGNDQDDTIMMAWTTARARIVGKDQTWLDDIVCSAKTPDDIRAAGDQVAALLRDRHHIAAGAEDDFNIRHPEDLAKARIKSAATLERLLLVIASLSLLVGGIGIMNVMLASVAQRTAEIGIRVATGARPAAIRVQFLGEAVMLTAVGGGLGVLLGASTTPTLAGALGWQVELSSATHVLAFAFAVATGVVSGYYPAARAAHLDPIQALRTEQ
jgi:putative ABC transport system permease protein